MTIDPAIITIRLRPDGEYELFAALDLFDENIIRRMEAGEKFGFSPAIYDLKPDDGPDCCGYFHATDRCLDDAIVDALSCLSDCKPCAINMRYYSKPHTDTSTLVWISVPVKAFVELVMDKLASFVKDLLFRRTEADKGALVLTIEERVKADIRRSIHLVARTKEEAAIAAEIIRTSLVSGENKVVFRGGKKIV